MPACDQCHRKFSTFAALDDHYGMRHPNKRKPAYFIDNVIAETEAKYRANSFHGRSSHGKLVFALILIIIIIGAGVYFVSTTSSNPPTQATEDPVLTCTNDAAGLAEHIHPHLEIVINGQPVTIPANIGLSATCEHPIHTHDTSGIIHIESNVLYPYTLHDFFFVWGQPFDSSQILQYKVDANHTLGMTVNGVPNNQYQNYAMKDGDQIVITYASA